MNELRARTLRCHDPACERPCRSDDGTRAKADRADEDKVWQWLGYQPAISGSSRIGRNKRQQANRKARSEHSKGKHEQSGPEHFNHQYWGSAAFRVLLLLILRARQNSA